MNGNISSLLLIHLLFLVLPAPLCAVTPNLTFSKVVPVRHLSTWWTAQNYCRMHHSDLVTIRNSQEAAELLWNEGWIGLHLSDDYEWKWSKGDENASFIPWSFGQPTIGEGCVFKYPFLSKWHSGECKGHRPFLCIDETLILVQEMKTWEDALLHCRELQAVGSSTKRLYDLAILSEANDDVLDREKIRNNAATKEVWVGLRFLAGEWLWMDGQAVTGSYLPHCPDPQEHCGALVHDDIQWKIMSCTEKRNFLCRVNL